MIQRLQKFYMTEITLTVECGADGQLKNAPPPIRDTFFYGAGIAPFWLISELAKCTLCLPFLLRSAGKNREFKEWYRNRKIELSASFCAIPISVLGILMPNTTNEKVLQIPRDGLPLRALYDENNP